MKTRVIQQYDYLMSRNHALIAAPATATKAKDVSTFAGDRHSSNGVGLSRTNATVYTEYRIMTQVATTHRRPHPSRLHHTRTLLVRARLFQQSSAESEVKPY